VGNAGVRHGIRLRNLHRRGWGSATGTWQQMLLSVGRGPGSVPLGLTLIEAQKYARRAEQLAVLSRVLPR
jgi:hypothetical protein